MPNTPSAMVTLGLKSAKRTSPLSIRPSTVSGGIPSADIVFFLADEYFDEENRITLRCRERFLVRAHSPHPVAQATGKSRDSSVLPHSGQEEFRIASSTHSLAPQDVATTPPIRQTINFQVDPAVTGSRRVFDRQNRKNARWESGYVRIQVDAGFNGFFDAKIAKFHVFVGLASSPHN